MKILVKPINQELDVPVVERPDGPVLTHNSFEYIYRTIREQMGLEIRPQGLPKDWITPNRTVVPVLLKDKNGHEEYALGEVCEHSLDTPVSRDYSTIIAYNRGFDRCMRQYMSLAPNEYHTDADAYESQISNDKGVPVAKVITQSQVSAVQTPIPVPAPVMTAPVQAQPVVVPEAPAISAPADIPPIPVLETPAAVPPVCEIPAPLSGIQEMSEAEEAAYAAYECELRAEEEVYPSDMAGICLTTETQSNVESAQIAAPVLTAPVITVPPVTENIAAPETPAAPAPVTPTTEPVAVTPAVPSTTKAAADTETSEDEDEEYIPESAIVDVPENLTDEQIAAGEVMIDIGVSAGKKVKELDRLERNWITTNILPESCFYFLAQAVNTYFGEGN